MGSWLERRAAGGGVGDARRHGLVTADAAAAVGRGAAEADSATEWSGAPPPSRRRPPSAAPSGRLNRAESKEALRGSRRAAQTLGARY